MLVETVKSAKCQRYHYCCCATIIRANFFTLEIVVLMLQLRGGECSRGKNYKIVSF